MRKFKFNSTKAANAANSANIEEKQNVVAANGPLMFANPAQKQDVNGANYKTLANISNRVAIENNNKIKHISTISNISRDVSLKCENQKRLVEITRTMDTDITLPVDECNTLSEEGSMDSEQLSGSLETGVFGIEKNTPSKPKLKIEKMTKCLHGRWCRHLKSEPPARPMCEMAGQPVFDLDQCPDWNWK